MKDGVKLDRYCYGVAIALTSCLALAADINQQATNPTGLAGRSPAVGQAQAGRPAAPGALTVDDVNEAMNLADSKLIRFTGRAVAGEAINAPIRLDGVEYMMELGLHSVRSPMYQVLRQVEDGSLVEVEPGPVNTYRGVLQGIRGSVVTASVLPDGLYARIQFPDEEEALWVQPLQRFVEGAGAQDYVVYRKCDIIDQGGTCGMTEEHTMHQDFEVIGGEGEGNPLSGGGGGSLQRYCAEIAFDADYEMQLFNGGVAGVEAHANALVNSVNIQYGGDVDIKHIITTILVRTAEPDPYSTTNASGLLNQFTNYWNANHGNIQRDVASLLTGKNLDGSTIGIAWLRQICTNLSYNVIEGDFSPFTCNTDLLAHELGHNWGAGHCTCSGYTMNASLTCSNRFHPSFTIPVIESYRNQRSFCLEFCELTPTTFPFFDDFPTTTLDPVKWTGIDEAQSNNFGSNEPSAPNSLNLDGHARFGGNEARTGTMDTSDAGLVQVDFYWQRTGNGNSPEPGDDLVVEYQRPSGTWIEFARYPGDGPDMTTYQFESIDLPFNPFFGAYHEDFRVRFRSVSETTGLDDWFVDDVSIYDAAGGTLCPTSFDVLFGVQMGGNVDSLCESDDDRLQIEQRFPVTPLLPNIRVEMEATAFSDQVTSLDFTLEARATAIPATVPQRLDLFNYDTGQWEQVDQRTATSSDSVVNLNFVSDPGRFIASGSREVKSRVSWFNPGNVINPAWRGEIDQNLWDFQ